MLEAQASSLQIREFIDSWLCGKSPKFLYKVGASSSTQPRTSDKHICEAGIMKDLLTLSWQNLAIDLFHPPKFCLFQTAQCYQREQGHFFVQWQLATFEANCNGDSLMLIIFFQVEWGAARSRYVSISKGLKLIKTSLNAIFCRSLRFLKDHI